MQLTLHVHQQASMKVLCYALKHCQGSCHLHLPASALPHKVSCRRQSSIGCCVDHLCHQSQSQRLPQQGSIDVTCTVLTKQDLRSF